MPRRSIAVRIMQVVSLAVVFVLFAALIFNAFQNGGKPLTTLSPEGPSSDSIQRLVLPVFAVAGVVFLGILGAVLFISWKFGEKEDDDPDEFPEQVHGRTWLEIGWTIVPAVILAAVSVGTVITILELSQKSDDAIEVEVTGQQWWWQFRYDINNDGSFDGPEDITTAGEMVIPTGKAINVTTTSNDVIHSFWIPALNGKKDAVPGLFSPLKLEADDVGVYRGQCTEFCGLSHGNMRMLVRAVPEGDYEAWVTNQLTDHAAEPTDELAATGRKTWESFCAQCHLIKGVNDQKLQETPPPLTSGVAPDLTHLMTRGTFAGSIFNLYSDVQSADPGANGELIGTDPTDAAAAGDPGSSFTGGPVDQAKVNRPALEAWIRNPPALKPAYAQGGRGMPNLNLTEDQIDELVAYLMTLN